MPAQVLIVEADCFVAPVEGCEIAGWRRPDRASWLNTAAKTWRRLNGASLRAAPRGARVDGLETRDHLSGSDRPARCPTGKVPAVGLSQ